MSEHIVEVVHHHDEPIEPILVKIAGVADERPEAPELSSWTTYVLAGTEAPFMLLPQDRKRHRAVILVNGTAGDFVVIGKQNQVSSRIGGRLYVGNSPEVHAQAAVWCIPAVTTSTQPIVITVTDERFTSE